MRPNNNNPTCRAPECRKTSVALIDRKLVHTNWLKSLTEYETPESRLEHSQQATIYDVTVHRDRDGRCSTVNTLIMQFLWKQKL